MDASDHQARRLFLAAALTQHVRQRLGGRLPTHLTPEGLRQTAEALRGSMDRIEALYRCSFEPAFPGVEMADAGAAPSRLVLTCALGYGGETAGTVYTTLIPGRPPQVSIAPAAASDRSARVP